MEATTKEYRSSVKLPLSNKVGSKRQKVTESDENLQLSYCRNKTILRKNAGMECHNKQIQRCMDRLSTSIPIEILSESINKLMVPAERILLLKMSIQEMVVNSSVRNDTSLIFTAGGISLLFAFCAARLPSVPSIGGMLPQTKIQFIDLFVSIDEFMADSKQRESVILFQDDPNIAMAGRLVGLYPFLTQMSEALLLFGDNLPSENSAQSELQISTMLGDVAEYSSRSVALCAVSLLGRFVITELWQSCNANLGAISFCEAFGSITGISDRANTSPEANVLQFLAEVEISSLQSRDALIGLSGMLFLLDVCGPCTKVTSDNPLKQHVELFNGSTMHMKMVSLAWRLCSGLQSAFTMVLPSKHAHMNGFIPVGKGILFGHLLAELSDTRLLVEALRRLDNADGDCVVCYSDAISIGQDFKQSKLSIEEFYFVKFWGYYFSFESPFNRTLGTQIAISSVFTTLLTASVPPAAVLEKQTIPLALFSRVDDENMLDYFRILTAFVPALYLGAQPKTSPGDDPNVTVSPYIHFLLVTSLVLDTVDTYAQLFDVITSKTKSEKAFTKKKTDFALNGLDVFCKTCKNTVIAMSVSVNRAVDWRNRQAMASLALDQTSNPSYQKEPDIGDLSLLVVVLKWAVVCTETIAKLASTVKQSALTACGGRKQISIRSLPLLTQACDKVMKHLHSILRRHGINHLDGVDEAERCYYANVLRTLSQRYLAKLVSFAGQRFDENSWNDIAAPKKDMFIEVNESIVAAASSQILSSERSTRWGIYQAEVWSCTPRDLPLSTTKAAKPSHTILSAKLPEVRQRCAVSSDEDSFDSTFLSSTDASSSDSKSESYLDDSSDFSDDSNATHSDDDWGEGNLVASKI